MHGNSIIYFQYKTLPGLYKNGIWIGHNYDPVLLPPQILSLFSNWNTSQSKTFRIFRKYWMDIATVCVSNKVENRMQHFLYKSSFNTCQEQIKTVAASRSREYLEHCMSPTYLNNINEILDPKLAQGLLDMS